MFKLIILLIIFPLNICSPYLHITILNYCTSCLILQQNDRILINHDFLSKLHQSKSKWKPHHSHNLFKDIQIKIVVNGELGDIEERLIDGEIVVIQKEYINIVRDVIERKDVQRLLRDGNIVIVNSTLKQHSITKQKNESNLIFVKQIDTNSLNDLIKQLVQKYKNNASQHSISITKSQNIKYRILSMCQSKLKTELLMDYSMILNHQNKQYFDRLLDQFEKNVGNPCEQNDKVSHNLSILLVLIGVACYGVNYYVNRKKERNISPI